MLLSSIMAASWANSCSADVVAFPSIVSIYPSWVGCAVHTFLQAHLKHHEKTTEHCNHEPENELPSKFSLGLGTLIAFNEELSVRQRKGCLILLTLLCIHSRESHDWNTVIWVWTRSLQRWCGGWRILHEFGCVSNFCSFQRM